jgi:hypothetical protein
MENRRANRWRMVSRTPFLERADEEDGHQRGDADAEDQERKFLALAFAF